MITRLSVPGHQPSIPFVGLAEGVALAAFTRGHRIPLRRVRSAVTALEVGLGLTNALASKHLYLLGPKLLYDYAEQAHDPTLMDLVELDQGQAVFAPIVGEYLQQVVYDDDGWAAQVRVPLYRRAEVYVDPQHGSGEPYFAPSGIPVADVVGRYLGGDEIRLLSEDYGIPAAQVEEAVDVAQRTAA